MPKHSRLAFLLAVTLTMLTPAGAADLDLLPFKATEATLPNGVKVILVPTGLPNLVSLQIPVQTGSRNEIEAGKTGFAHFFEHMMFRGTKAYPAVAYGEIQYDGDKTAALLAEDKVVGARKLGIRPEAVTVTPLAEVFAN